MTTIQARLKVKGEEKKTLDDLMRRWSSCMRFAYKRLLEGKKRNDLKRELHFSYKKLKERIIRLARRYGIAVKEVNPAYTSVIGMLKYAPQLSLTKDIASAWVIARRGLGLSEGVPRNYKVFLQVAQGSPQRESGRADGSTDGRNLSAPKHPKGALYNLWRVLGVAVLTALSPEGQRIPRCLSPLKRLLISGDVGRTLEGRETLLPGAGSVAGEIAPAGFIPSLKRRDINSPALNCTNVRFG